MQVSVGDDCFRAQRGFDASIQDGSSNEVSTLSRGGPESSLPVATAQGRKIRVTTSLRIAVVLLGAVGSVSGQGVVTTVAGSGWIIPRLSMPAAEAPLGLVASMTVDRDRNPLVADSLNHIVFRVMPDGTFVSVAGNGLRGSAGDEGPATRASLSTPAAVAADLTGNVFIAEETQIRRVDANGVIRRFAGPGSRAPADGVAVSDADVSEVSELAVLPGGDLLMLDPSRRRIFRVDTSGTLRLFAGNGRANCGQGLGGPAVAASLCNPRSLTADSAGNVYLIDGVDLFDETSAVRRISPAGTITPFAGNGESGRPENGAVATESPLEPRTLTIDAAGRLIIANVDEPILRGITVDLVRIAQGVVEVMPAQDWGPHPPTGLVYLADGTLAFSTFQPTRISRIRADGVVEKFGGSERFGYGGDGGPAVLAKFNVPYGVALDPEGNLFVADTGNGRIRRVSRDGVVRTAAGNGDNVPEIEVGPVPATSAPLLLPFGITAGPGGGLWYSSLRGIYSLTPDGYQNYVYWGYSWPGELAFDSSGRLIMPDLASNLVLRMTDLGIMSPIAGDGRARSSGDGGPAQNASLNQPVGVAVGADGSVYISEFAGHRVRRIAPDGIISTFAGTGADTASMPGGPVRASETRVSSPTGLAVDGAGNVLIRSDGYISRVSPGGELQVMAGVGPKGVISGDGGPAAQAAISAEGGIAVDRDGSVYFAESDFNRVRKILATAPGFAASPTLLEFSAASGSASSRPQTITVTGEIPGLGFTVRIRTAAGGNWLSANVSEGATPRLLQVVANPASVAPGTYLGTVELEAPHGMPSTRTVSVRFSVGAALPPNLLVDQSSLSFTYPRTARRRGQMLVLSNSGSGTINYEADASVGSFLVLTLARGTVAAGSPLPLRVEADPGTRRPGTYRDTITIRWSGGTRTVNVVMTISEREQGILLSQAGFSFQAVAQGGVVPPQTFRVLNTGNGSMPWRASASTLAGGERWLQVSAATGVSTSGQAARDVEVRVAQDGLAPGVYYGLVQVEAIGAANTPHVLTVALEVLPQGSRPGSVVLPRELTFELVEGQSASSEDLAVFNLAGSPMSFRSTAQPLTSSHEISYGPIDAQVAPNDPQRIVVQPQTAGLPPGTHRSPITLQFEDGTVRQVDVNVVVAPGGASPPAKIDPRRGADGCNPKTLLVGVRSIGQTSTVTAGWPTAVVAELHDDCGRSVDDGAVTMLFSNGDPPVALQPVKDGLWHGTWAPRSAATGNVTIRLQAEERESNLRGEREVVADLRAAQDPPEVLTGAIVNTPTPGSTAPLSPGGLITVNGARITLNQALTAPSRQNLPTRLQDTEIIVGGRRLPLFSAAANRVEAILPFDLTPNTSHQVLVRRGSTYSRPTAVDVASAQPAILLNSQVGGSQALAEVRRPGAAPVLNAPANAARPGDTLVIFCSGLGTVTGTLEAGQLTPSGSAIRPVATVRARIGGLDAPVSQASLTEGEIGRYQVVVTVPAPVAAGDRISVEIEAEGLASAPATVAITR